VPQDGITAPSDFNASASTWVRNVWNGTATGNSAGTMTYDAASGYYTLTITGVKVPDSAVMLTGGLGYTYTLGSSPPLTQVGVVDPIASNTTFGTQRFGVTQSTLVATKGLGWIGGLVVVTPDAQKVATNYSARRAIVDDALCNKCHFELGMFTAEAFHAGQRNDGTTCSWCHNPNRTSSAWSAGSASFIHAIHAADKRNKPFTWHASAVGKSFADVGYPGVLNKCETCHLPGMYDFSAAASSAALPNRLYTTVGTGKYNGTVAGSLAAYQISPYVVADNVTNYGAGFAFNASAATASNITKGDGTVVSNPAQGTFNAEATTLVISPIATTCFSCHDSDTAKGHMESNGASIYAARGTPAPGATGALAKAEQCMFCHQQSSAFGLGIAQVHK
jgi:OmcA/MtrC family decaheme c-type cytochrome